MIPSRWRISASRAFNRITGGQPGTTFSAQSAWRARHGASPLSRAIGRACVAFIDWFTRDAGHCERAYQLEIERGRFP